MNLTEQKALRWIMKQGYSENDIVFRSRETPDFITSDGTTYEAKKIYGKNKVWIYTTQVEKLRNAKAIILAFDEGDTPKVILSAENLIDGGIYNGIRFVEIDNTSDTAIVIRDLTQDEVRELRLLKLQLNEPSWRTLFLRVLDEWRNKIDVEG